MTGLGALVVLHGVPVEHSAALTGLLASSSDAAGLVVLVQDNTPGAPAATPLPVGVDELTVRPDNPGLADAYRWAAARLRARGVEWMLVLDQDTTVTSSYLAEVAEVVTGRRPVPEDVAVLLPRLVDRGRVLSPHRRVRIRTRPVPDSRPGPASGWVTHLNSGSVLRLSALEEAGGVPLDFPLDGLDHAIAHRLRSAGFRSWLLASSLEHRLSLLDPEGPGAVRLAAVLDAEHRLHATLGGRSDRGWLAVRRLLGLPRAVVRRRGTDELMVELRAAARACDVLVPPRGGRSR